MHFCFKQELELDIHYYQDIFNYLVPKTPWERWKTESLSLFLFYSEYDKKNTLWILFSDFNPKKYAFEMVYGILIDPYRPYDKSE